MKPFATRQLLALMSCLFAVSVPGAVRAEPRLFPTLAPFQFMVGSWQCRSWAAAAGRRAPHMDAVTAKYSVVGGGAALGQHVIGPDYRRFVLFGIAPESNRIVTSTYGDDGTRVLASSPGWAGNAIMLSGKVQRGGSAADLRDILLRFTDRRFTDTTEVRERGRWKTVANSDCNKQ
jgi:hypothetical protein